MYTAAQSTGDRSRLTASCVSPVVRPGRPGEADLWREPRRFVVGGDLSDAVRTAGAPRIRGGDPPAGGGQKG